MCTVIAAQTTTKFVAQIWYNMVRMWFVLLDLGSLVQFSREDNCKSIEQNVAYIVILTNTILKELEHQDRNIFTEYYITRAARTTQTYTYNVVKPSLSFFALTQKCSL